MGGGISAAKMTAAAAGCAKLEINDLKGGNFRPRKKSMINW